MTLTLTYDLDFVHTYLIVKCDDDPRSYRCHFKVFLWLLIFTVRFLLNEPAFSIASPWVGVLLCSRSAAAWQKRSPYLPLHCRCARILLGSVVDSHCILHKLACWWKRQSRANKSATHSARMRALIWGYEAFRTWLTWDKQPPSTFDFFFIFMTIGKVYHYLNVHLLV